MFQGAVREVAADHTPTRYTATERQGNETVKAPYSIEAGKEIHYKISDYRSFFITFAFGLGATPLQDILENKEALCLSRANENVGNFQPCTRIA